MDRAYGATKLQGWTPQEPTNEQGLDVGPARKWDVAVEFHVSASPHGRVRSIKNVRHVSDRFPKMSSYFIEITTVPSRLFCHRNYDNIWC